MKRKGKTQKASPLVGVVVEIREQDIPKKEETEWLRGWMSRLGRQVDVLWENGRLSKNFAENSLEVIDE